ncbi:hypothetical protein A2631_00910 [Candidatus Daviesbacteria bacterium RIFCSPHIGHO2_01_FULL_44_29]|uniref:Lactamase n=1 Tax=Candidatus Daviesbacteria bacterium RIFCSPHIGHO2_02_FULL_43_12 TaxID=1797776 RepID=A0A1F5KHE9_9BACT|nr:MAG: hypothetical protein A2631_00910 [Candidatus Daviesbacteria bacterium RIFCSPHIGHO2_01_FULL_44_29]OGE39304.1 MAG: hypothetical protein A3E86_00670 [Candidatus Daviesbacteria bacterium RIFCSPHIGHO2_12_FULL_47_45]OGE40279.1 MAG: hypothetical protein A3D25_05375 [Candidatus Daviesbacteria bacterium RIFCSPHIGHO2_02_FULL_43_12]OGE69078.1 MAG: hypothetical protein A3B55_02455 [Candidatus Daviesbacteria bacterium RIFCSPLOWO2_01_FULL_43_15]
MEIYYLGHACFKLKGKTSSIIIDPFNTETGLKLPKDMQADACLITHNHSDHNNQAAVTGSPVVLNGPGEYEVKGVAVTGIASYHDNVAGAERGANTIYNIYIDGLNIVHLGDLGQDALTEAQESEIGITDILLIPVGGTYTITAKQASSIVAQLEPRIIIPMHYGVEGLKYPLEGVASFLKEMGVESLEPVSKLSITKDKLPDEPQVVVLSKING